jgi:hypothetical protein
MNDLFQAAIRELQTCDPVWCKYYPSVNIVIALSCVMA